MIETFRGMLGMAKSLGLATVLGQVSFRTQTISQKGSFVKNRI